MSDTSPDTGTVTEDTSTDTADTVDWRAEAEKHKALARKHEDRAKANAAAARELEQLKQQTMTETDKAVAAARDEGRNEAMREFASSRVEDAVRVAAAGRNVDVDALLDGLDRTRFIGDDGQPDRNAVQAWIDRIAPQTDDSGLPPDLGQGVRTSSTMALNGDPLLRDLKSKLGIS